MEQKGNILRKSGHCPVTEVKMKVLLFFRYLCSEANFSGENCHWKGSADPTLEEGPHSTTQGHQGHRGWSEDRGGEDRDMGRSLAVFLQDEMGLARYTGYGFASVNNFRGLGDFSCPWLSDLWPLVTRAGEWWPGIAADLKEAGGGWGLDWIVCMWKACSSPGSHLLSLGTGSPWKSSPSWVLKAWDVKISKTYD